MSSWNYLVFFLVIFSISIFSSAFAALPPACVGCEIVEVSIPEGSGVPGCEETNQCYIPATVTISVGGTVTWSNDDTAAHTVTSGVSPNFGGNGPDGNFDSGLFMAGTTFAHTFDSAGEFTYFCMVHPWMQGVVIVQGASEPEPEPTPVHGTTVTIPSGAGHVNNLHFSPTALSINVGETVTWSNDDTAAHTVTSGNREDGPDGNFDSSLFMAGSSFAYTFREEGSFEYFCMVHPWEFNGEGVIIVGDTGGQDDFPQPEPTPSPEDCGPNQVFQLGQCIDIDVPSPTITVSTDKITYDHDSTIFVNGKVTNPQSNIVIVITVFSPTGNIVILDQLSPDSFGNFNSAFRTEGGLWKYDGTYTI